MNVTLLSLSIVTHFSFSPFYTLPLSFNDGAKISIIDSYFSNSFSNILYSATVLRQTLIKRNTFSFILQNSLCFSKENEETFKPTVIKGKTFDSQYHYEIQENQGKIMIVGCKFNKCTAEYGGGLLIEQDCYLILHGTVFLECKTTGNGGGAYLCGGSITYSKENKDFTGPKLEEVDIQYCCFNRCISQRGNDEWNGYGASAMIAGKVVKLLFSTSTSHFQSKQDDQRSRGAQFDIQSNEINLEFVNVTEAYSSMCGGIEIRHATRGLIKYQTFYLNDSPCLEMFTNLDNQGIIVSECNMIENVLRSYDGNNPAMIYTRDASIEISNCFISGTKISDNLKLAIKEAYYKDYSSVTIKLVNFSVWGFEHNQEGDYIRENVNFRYDVAYFIPISHLGLNECAGNISVAPLIITPIFTSSAQFSFSEPFSNSAIFTNSDKFTKSSGFSETKEFTFTGQFTKTTAFTNSRDFTKSSQFSFSFYFTESAKFSKSKNFTKSIGFSDSNEFTFTGQFTKTGLFTESKDFSQSRSFTDSRHFDASGTFTPSNNFTQSLDFTYSSFFSQSTEFSYSSVFSNSGKFSFTKEFTFSDIFVDSSQFTDSFYFTFSKHFSETKKFSNSIVFSKSKSFSSSNHFDVTNTFTPSRSFTPSDEFNASSHFTNSFYFTFSSQFSDSDHFTKSSAFSPSNEFLSSKEFVQSSHFTKSTVFSPSKTIRNEVVIKVNESTSKNKGIIIGGAVAAVVCAVGIVAGIVAFIVNRHRRFEQDSDMFLDLNPIEDNNSSITYNNVLHGLDMEDDPFEDDFNNDHN